MQRLKKLKIILPLSIILTTIIYCSIYLNINHESKYSISDTEFVGMVVGFDLNEKKTTVTLKGKEKLLVNYYEEINIKIGDKIKVIGELQKPNSNTNFNLFNYKKYLLSNKINYIVNAESIEKISSSNNLFYIIKNKINEMIGNNIYLKAFILGNNKGLDEQVKKSYQTNGISHLFSVSGMHVGFLSSILMFILKPLNKKYSKFILILLLLFYVFLANFSPSIMRAVLFLIIINLKNKFNINISTFNLFLILTCLFLIYNPYYIYHLGFIYSFTISGFLILFNKKIKDENYFRSLLKVSILAFLVSFPITIYNNFEINLLSPILNLFFVPFITFIIFPFSFLVFLFPFLNSIYLFLTNVLENISLFFSEIHLFHIVLLKPSIFVVMLYYFIIILVIKNKRHIFLFVIMLIIHSNIRIFNKYPIVAMLDVGQGDSLLIELPHNKGNILIDTGGNYSENNYLSNNIIIPYLKSRGIKQLDYTIITHGDYDHMGEVINLVKNFKVEKVMFNCGEFNELEQDLIRVLDKKKIPYYFCIKELNIDNNKLYFLNNKDYGNENDNSSVIYTELNNHKFLFMGDAGVEVEEDLIEKYSLQNIDVLKVGHHGSKTSSSEEFINEIEPKYSIISVGKNNRYGHPNKEALNNLKESQIYRTDKDGSIMFKINNNKLKIETCEP